MSTKTEIDTLMAQLEEMWGHQDTLFRQISETNQWNSEHGDDWTYADVPYHLTYCNRDLVIRPMQLGRDLPEDERVTISTIDDLDEWNGREFAARPADQTAEESLAQLRASWDEIRSIGAAWTDGDLERPWWMPFMGGMWLTVRDGLGWTLGHDWSEFMQLRIRMGRSKPAPSPEITTHFLGMAIAGLYPQMLDAEAARGREFCAVMAFTDLGVSSFTIEVVDDQASVRPGEADNADLVITQNAETFEKTRSGIQTLSAAIQEGKVQVNDMEGLAILGELFPMG